MKNFLKNTNGGFFYRDKFWLFLPNKKIEMTQEDIDLLSKVKFNKIKLNENINFTFNEKDKYLGVGWSHNFGNEGVWSEGYRSYILFGLENLNKDNLKVNLNFRKYKSNKDKKFNVKIYFNNTIKNNINLNEDQNLNNITFNIKKTELKEENIIMFEFDNLISPLEIFESPDARKLGILLKNLSINF